MNHPSSATPVERVSMLLRGAPARSIFDIFDIADPMSSSVGWALLPVFEPATHHMQTGISAQHLRHLCHLRHLRRYVFISRMATLGRLRVRHAQIQTGRSAHLTVRTRAKLGAPFALFKFFNLSLIYSPLTPINSLAAGAPSAPPNWARISRPPCPRRGVSFGISFVPAGTCRVVVSRVPPLKRWAIGCPWRDEDHPSIIQHTVNLTKTARPSGCRGVSHENHKQPHQSDNGDQHGYGEAQRPLRQDRRFLPPKSAK